MPIPRPEPQSEENEYDTSQNPRHTGANGAEGIDYSFLDFKTVDQLSDVAPVQVWSDVICLGDRVMIAGATKSYKSFFAKQLSYCITYGLPFLDRKMVNAIPMLDLDMELREYFCKLRTQGIAWAMNGGEVDRCKTICLRGQARKLDALAVKELGKRMVARGLKGLCLDPIYKLQRNGLGDNSASEVNTLLDPFDEISFTLELLFIWIHHHSKGAQAAKESIDRASGSGGWARSADVIIDLIAHKNVFCFIVQITQRNFPAISKFVVEFDINGSLTFRTRTDLSPDDVAESQLTGKGRPKKIDQQIEVALAIVRAFDDQDGVDNATWRDLCMFPQSSFTKVKKAIVPSKVYERKTDNRYFLTSVYKKECQKPC